MVCNITKFNLSDFNNREDLMQYAEKYFIKVINNAKFQSVKVVISDNLYNDYNFNFWHCITDTDTHKNIILKRLEKISFIKMLNGCEYKCNYFKYKNTNKNRIKIICKKKKYAIILEDRKTHYFLISAYPLYSY